MADLFLFPVMLAGFVLRLRGLWCLPAALALYHLGESWRGNHSFEEILLNDLTQLLEWSLVMAVILVTLDKFVASRQLQEAMDKDLELARVLQSALLAPAQQFGRLKMRGYIHQCHDVGGDFYYFRPFQKKYVVFCLGDVMGKGISASLLMSMVMSFMFEWGKKSTSPALILAKLNYRLNRLWNRDVGWFLTLFYAVYDEESEVLTYACGGHQAALIIRKNGELETAHAEGLPLGVTEDAEFSEGNCPLSKGDRVLLFTDGVSEARSPEGELFGVERLQEVVRRNHRLDELEDLSEAIKTAVLKFTGGCYTDDLALLLVEVV